jgi:hypothetical protein
VDEALPPGKASNAAAVVAFTLGQRTAISTIPSKPFERMHCVPGSPTIVVE